MFQVWNVNKSRIVVLVLLSALVERCFVSRMRDFFYGFFLRFVKLVVMDLPPPSQKKNCLDPCKQKKYIFIEKRKI